jgi:maleylpyruvate isomerase
MLRLHGYWRSTASYRVRIALNLKGLPYEQATYDLRTGGQKSPDYVAIAPHGLVPALETDEGVIVESPAILEWLEERFVQPRLLPDDTAGRAAVRAMAALIGSDIHPLNNLRVLQALRSEFGAAPEAVDRWISRWVRDGFTALEVLVARHGKGFAFGPAATLADCYLVPQVYSAQRFGVDLADFPAIRAAAATAGELAAVQAAHPDRQPDADRP